MDSRTDKSPSRHVAIAILFIVLAVILGGGGTPNPGTEIALQMAFVVAALVWIWMPTARVRTPVPQSASFWLLCVLVLALPVFQLIPLPSGIWSSLPGEQDRVDALALVGKDASWQPISRYPVRTLASLLAIIPPLFAFFATAAMDTRSRMKIVGTIATMAVVTALFGAMQLSMGENAPNLYADHHKSLTGFQANRNATVDLLLMGMVAAAVFFAPSVAPRGEAVALPSLFPAGRRGSSITLASILVLLLLAAVLTGSRTGIALIPFALIAVCLVLMPALADFGRMRLLPVAIAIIAMVGVAVFALFGGNRALDTVVDRFGSEGGRAELWQDAWYAAMGAWPFGVGVGGAQPALVAAERLEIVDLSQPNRVHNDYLELVLEGGLPGVVLLVAVACVLVFLAFRTWRDRPQERLLTGLGCVILFFCVAHSFVDYPLRSMALACLIGTGAGLLVASPQRQSIAHTGNSSHE